MSTFENFVAMVEGWTAEERGQVFTLLGGGVVAAVSTPVKTVAAKKAVAPKAPVKKAMPSKPLPEGVPTAADYRLSEADIDLSVCLGRVFAAEPDKRFRPAVYQEGQCGAAPVEGGDLCATCQRRMTKYAEAGVEKPGPWLGRVSEDPMPWSNMLDSAKMLAKPPKWVADGGSDAGSAGGGSEGPASEGGAESEGAEQMPLSSSSSSAPVVAVGGAGAPPKPVKLSAAEKAAALAEKAKVAAEKAAAAVAKKKAAEAKKAEAEAKKAEKAAAPPKAKAPAKKAAAAAPAASVVLSNSAASSAEPVEAEGEFDMLDGELRFVRNGNVYEFDAMTEKVGAFLGRKTADGTIDTDADELGAAEAE
jgi:hypothetical protein